jgi:hypothetical protein
MTPGIWAADGARVEQMADNFAVLGYALLGEDGNRLFLGGQDPPALPRTCIGSTIAFGAVVRNP